MKYIFIHLISKTGNYGFNEKSVHTLGCAAKHKDFKDFALNYAKTYYSGKRVTIDENTWSFNGNDVIVELFNYKEITEEEYSLLNKYL